MEKQEQQNTELFKVRYVNEIFSAVEKENVYMIMVGNSIMSPKEFETFEELVEYVESKPWELIASLTAYLCYKSKSYENRKTKDADY